MATLLLIAGIIVGALAGFRFGRQRGLRDSYVIMPLDIWCKIAAMLIAMDDKKEVDMGSDYMVLDREKFKVVDGKTGNDRDLSESEA